MAFVLPTETFKDAVLVLPNSLTQVACHSDVQNARNACDHVHEIVVLFHTSTTYCGHFFNSVNPTKCNDWRSRSLRAWRDLLFSFTQHRLGANKQQVPRLRRSSASRTIFFARDDRVFFISICGTAERRLLPSILDITTSAGWNHYHANRVAALPILVRTADCKRLPRVPASNLTRNSYCPSATFEKINLPSSPELISFAFSECPLGVNWIVAFGIAAPCLSATMPQTWGI